jgi:hypothetical protein
MLPSGNCTVRLPWRKRCSSLKTVRAAAGVPRGKAKGLPVEEPKVRVFMVVLRSGEGRENS